MFVSYDWEQILQDGDSRRIVGWKDTLVDTEFTECLIIEGADGNIHEGLCDIIIAAYGKRNLPIALNLFRGIQFFSKKHGFTIASMLLSMKDTPKYSIYLEEIEKYLTLL